MSKSLSDDARDIDKLNNSEDFQMWKFQVKVLLNANQLGPLILTDTAEASRTAEWKTKDAKAQKTIITTVSKKIITHLISCTTAFEMWTKLTQIFEKDNEQQKSRLLENFYSKSYDGSTDIATYISELKHTSIRLLALNVNIQDEMLISKILSTLPQDYRHFLSAWDSTETNQKTLDNLTARLLAEEMRNKTAEMEGETIACKVNTNRNNQLTKPNHCSRDFKPFNKHKTNTQRSPGPNIQGHASGSSSNRMKTNWKGCSICKKTNHSEKDCFYRKQCTICKKVNHTEEDCYFRDRPQKVAYLTTNNNDCETWVIDSGCTSHMTNRGNIFNNFIKTQSKIGIAKNNESMISKGIGNIEFDKCLLKEVMYVPDLKCNLLSVNAITNAGGNVRFSKDKVIISNTNKQSLQGYKTKNGLFQIDLTKTVSADSYLTTDDTNPAINWHRRLGHISLIKLKELRNISDGIKITLSELKELEKVCDICQKAKQTRLKFENSRSTTTKPLQLIHTDVCGPISPATWDKRNYFVTFIDDFTHHVETYPIKTKDEVTKILMEYVRKVQAKWNMKVVSIRCDNGREFVNTKITEFCKANGTNLNCTTPYTPQLNGKAERLNRTLLDKIRALLFDSKLKKKHVG